MRIWFDRNLKCEPLSAIRFPLSALSSADSGKRTAESREEAAIMYSRLLHLSLFLLLMTAFLTRSAAQDKDRPKQTDAPPPTRSSGDEDDYRRLFKRPTTT